MLKRPPMNNCIYRGQQHYPTQCYLCFNPGCPHFHTATTEIVCTNCAHRAPIRQPPPSYQPPTLAEELANAPEILPPMNPADIMAGLPPFQEGRDRPLHVEPDGTIVYEPGGDWFEPPMDINGYQRDPVDPLRFIPLWKPCLLRFTFAVRFPRCGCVNLIMRCNNPHAPRFQDRVAHTDCDQCPLRKEA
jgi:hypothetical protein